MRSIRCCGKIGPGFEEAAEAYCGKLFRFRWEDRGDLTRKRWDAEHFRQTNGVREDPAATEAETGLWNVEETVGQVEGCPRCDQTSS